MKTKMWVSQNGLKWTGWVFEKHSIESFKHGEIFSIYISKYKNDILFNQHQIKFDLSVGAADTCEGSKIGEGQTFLFVGERWTQCDSILKSVENFQIASIKSILKFVKIYTTKIMEGCVGVCMWVCVCVYMYVRLCVSSCFEVSSWKLAWG